MYNINAFLEIIYLKENIIKFLTFIIFSKFAEFLKAFINNYYSFYRFKTRNDVRIIFPAMLFIILMIKIKH